MRLPKVLAAVIALVLAAGAASVATLRPRHPPPRVPSLAWSADLVASPRTPRSAAAHRTASSAQTGPTPTGAGAGASGGPGFQAPASGVPVDPSGEPGGSPGWAGPKTTSSQVVAISLPVPTSASLPPVAALKTVNSPDALVLLGGTLTPAEAAKVGKLAGVSALEEVDAGTVNLSGAPAVTFGVDPGTFREFTPAASAASNQLWQYLAGGSLVSSYEMATDRGLKLGSEAAISPAGSTRSDVRGWVGAFASIGLPGVDMLVADTYSGRLGLTPRSGLVVSAPNLAGPTLQTELQSALPGAAVELLRTDQFPGGLSGSFVTSGVRQRLITAALSREGMPYVWGAAGPASFDCSGLVQWAYRQAGILMPRTAAEQFLTGDHIPLADAQPGDLLFWTYDPNDPGFVDHTAIYLGNGLMVVAPHSGLGVEVDPVTSSDFAGAVQVVLRNT